MTKDNYNRQKRGHRQGQPLPNIGQIIRETMRREGRGPQWLSEQIHCSRINIYNIYKCRSINTELLYRISEALNEDFFDIYSKRLYKKTIQNRK